MTKLDKVLMGIVIVLLIADIITTTMLIARGNH